MQEVLLYCTVLWHGWWNNSTTTTKTTTNQMVQNMLLILTFLEQTSYSTAVEEEMVLEVSTYHELQVSQIIASSVILTIVQSKVNTLYHRFKEFLIPVLHTPVASSLVVVVIQ